MGSAWGDQSRLRTAYVAASVPPSFAFNMSLSQYAIRVWVVGPVGTQPLALAR